jgi:hypothetical protein
MIRHLGALVIVLCVSAEPLFGQGPQLTVTAPTAEIHKFPSVGSPVIGKVTRGTVLEITREIGHWVRVWWPGGEGSAGYVHVTAGSVSPGSGSSGPSSGPTPGAAAAAAVRPQPGLQIAADSSLERRAPAAPQDTAPATYISLPTHVMGLGAGLNPSSRGFKATVRGWSKSRVGFQFEVSRDELTNPLVSQRATSVRFEPSVIYSLPDAAGSYVWVRPYVGGGASLYRSTLNDAASLTNGITDSGMDLRAFGGGEITLSTMPRFALSADLAYRRPRTSFVGFDTPTFNLSLSGHWYIK